MKKVIIGTVLTLTLSLSVSGSLNTTTNIGERNSFFYASDDLIDPKPFVSPDDLMIRKHLRSQDWSP